MIRIAVVDDEQSAVDDLTKKILKAGSDLGENFQLFSYTNGNEFLNDKVKYNIVFLDIEMPSINGIEVAKLLRKYDQNIQIVYVTNYHQYWRNAYQVHAFQYIEKPCKTQTIKQVLIDYSKMINDYANRSVTLKLLNGRKLVIAYDKIIYISCGSQKRQVVIVTEDGDHICKSTISELFLMLDDLTFFMPHRSHIVNMNHILSYRKNINIIMSNNDVIPLSKVKTEEFEKSFARNLHYKISR